MAEPDPMLYDIDLEVGLAPEGKGETILSRTNYNVMYHSAAQQLTRHTTSGCPMHAGDLLGSGTISGPKKTIGAACWNLAGAAKNP